MQRLNIFNTNSFRVSFSTFILVFISFTTLPSCNDSNEFSSELTSIRPIHSLQIKPLYSYSQKSFNGIVQATIEKTLSFKVTGKVNELPSWIGMKVKEGDLIAQLDTTDYELSVKQIIDQLNLIKDEFEKTKKEYQIKKQLYTDAKLSENEFKKFKTPFLSMETQLNTLEEKLESAKKNLENCSLLAPISGKISSILVETNQYIAPGQVIAIIVQNRQLEMGIDVPVSLINQLQVGNRASLSFKSIPNRTFHAKISQVGVNMSEQSTYPVKLQILESDMRLNPGIKGKAILKFRSASKQEFITIPSVSVFGSPDGQKSVWIFKSDEKNPSKGIVRKRNIKIGSLTSSGLQVTDGLSPGDIIAIRGIHRLSEGMRVRIYQDEQEVAK